MSLLYVFTSSAVFLRSGNFIYLRNEGLYSLSFMTSETHFKFCMPSPLIRYENLMNVGCTKPENLHTKVVNI